MDAATRLLGRSRGSYGRFNAARVTSGRLPRAQQPAQLAQLVIPPRDHCLTPLPAAPVNNAVDRVALGNHAVCFGCPWPTKREGS